MNRVAVQWSAAAVLTLGLGALLLMVAAAVMPSASEAAERGTYAPWLLTWGMIWTTVLTAVVLAGFLVRSARGRHP
jgi:hypothetical protein